MHLQDKKNAGDVRPWLAAPGALKAPCVHAVRPKAIIMARSRLVSCAACRRTCLISRLHSFVALPQSKLESSAAEVAAARADQAAARKQAEAAAERETDLLTRVERLSSNIAQYKVRTAQGAFCSTTRCRRAARSSQPGQSGPACG